MIEHTRTLVPGFNSNLDLEGYIGASCDRDLGAHDLIAIRRSIACYK